MTDDVELITMTEEYHRRNSAVIRHVERMMRSLQGEDADWPDEASDVRVRVTGPGESYEAPDNGPYLQCTVSYYQDGYVGDDDVTVYPAVIVHRETRCGSKLKKWRDGDQVYVEEANEEALTVGRVYLGDVVGSYKGRGLVEVQLGGGGSDGPAGDDGGWAILTEAPPDGGGTCPDELVGGEMLPNPYSQGWAWASATMDETGHWHPPPGWPAGDIGGTTCKKQAFQSNRFKPSVGDVVFLRPAPIASDAVTAANAYRDAHGHPKLAPVFVFEWAMGRRAVVCGTAACTDVTDQAVVGGIGPPVSVGTPAVCLFTCEGIMGGCWAVRIGDHYFPIVALDDDGSEAIG